MPDGGFVEDSWGGGVAEVGGWPVGICAVGTGVACRVDEAVANGAVGGEDIAEAVEGDEGTTLHAKTKPSNTASAMYPTFLPSAFKPSLSQTPISQYLC